MFILHSSNKTENLLEHLATVLKSAPLTSPFAKEIFLIQSQGMERWLSQQLAEHFKVWGNFCYLFPAKFFNTLCENLQKDLNNTDFDREKLLWRFEKIMRQLDQDVFKPLKNYLSGENVDLKRFHLAKQLTRVFDQYQMLRPDLLDTWENGRSLYHADVENWQRALWLILTTEIGQQHRGKTWQRVIQRLKRATPGEFAQILPERIAVFGINSLSPLFLSYLQALSQHCDVHLYLLNPVHGYWADLPNKHLQTQLSEFAGHPLLISLGQQGREFQQLLLEQAEFHFEPSSFEANTPKNNLQVLQKDILNNQITSINLQADDSISINACHSRYREVQVLKNQLLVILENQAGLELKDILVMAPDIQLYEPFINAVFHDIPHAIADRSLSISNTVLNTLIAFLVLSQTRLGWQSVLDLFEQPAIYRNFGLLDADMQLIRHWITETNVRWGQSAAHKQSLGLPPQNQNTWQAGLDRLFIGYAMGDDETFFEDVLPYINIEGSSSQALGGFNDFLQLLFKAGEELQKPKTFIEWKTALFHYAEKLFGNADLQERLPLNELLIEMEQIAAIHSQPLTLEVILAWLKGRMNEVKSSNGFLRGQLTFCSMLPMRSIPFQVIALLGMNDGEFPKIERNPSFDLLSVYPRLGDRSRRADDRYQFLEILLSARSQLIITYIGQSPMDNREIPVSIVVSELLEVLQDCYGLTNLVTKHPIHSFSPRYFDNTNPKLFSYEKSDLETAKNLRQKQQTAAIWWQGKLNLPNNEPIYIEDLLLFYNHPQRFFLQQLGISLPKIVSEPEEREPFALDALNFYLVSQEWIATELNGKSFSLETLQAQGLWPAGAVGNIEWLNQQPVINQFIRNIQSKALGPSLPALPVDINLGKYRLIGQIANRYAHGILLHRYATLKGKDFLAAWLHHLLINCVDTQNTYLLSKDQDLVFLPNTADKLILEGLIEVFLQGKQQPDAFFTEAAFCYIQQKNPDAANHAVIQQMLEWIENGYEPEIAKLLLNRDLTAIFDENFSRQCQTLLYPAWSGVHGD